MEFQNLEWRDAQLPLKARRQREAESFSQHMSRVITFDKGEELRARGADIAG